MSTTSRIRRALAALVVALLAVGGVAVTASPAVAAGGTISGTITRGGSPAAGAGVTLGTWNGVGYDNWTSVFANGSGVYSFTNLTTATYTVVARTSGNWADTWAGNEPWVHYALPITVNNNSQTVNISQILGGSLTVNVVQGAGQTPSAGAFVNFCHYDTIASYCQGSGNTNGSGTFTATGLAPATWQTIVTKDGFPGEYYNDFALDAFGPLDEVTVTPGGTTSVTFWLRSDKAPSRTFFQDVPSTSTYFSAVQWVVEHGISTGTAVSLERPLYKPLDAVSRQAMAQFLSRLNGVPFAPGPTPHFADVPSTSTFYAAIEWMYAAGLSTGTPQPSGPPLYKPLEPVSRQAMASFLYRLSGETFSAPGTASFADVPTTSANYTAIEWLKSKGISTGTPQPSGLPLYKPLDPVSRQAMALFLYRYANPGGGSG